MNNLFSSIWDYVENVYLNSKNPLVIEIFFVIVVGIISYLTTFIKFFSLFTEDTNLILKIIFVLLLTLTAVIVTILIRKLRLFRSQILERNGFIEVMANKYDPNYIIHDFQEIHEINNKGGCFFKRKAVLRYIDRIVPWYEMFMGSNDPMYSERNNERRNKIKTISAIDHRLILANLPYKNNHNKTYHAILLNPILTPATPESSFILTRKWDNIWSKLITEYNDKGSIELRYLVTKFELTIILPNGFEFTRNSVNPPIGHWTQINIDQQQRQYISLMASDVQPNTYIYEIEVRKI